MRKSLENVEQFEEDSDDGEVEEIFSKPVRRNKEPSPRKKFGAIGSGTRKNTSQKFDGPLLSSSPQVGRLVRLPSMDNVMPFFTNDSSYRMETKGFGRLDDMQLTRVPKLYGKGFFVFVLFFVLNFFQNSTAKSIWCF